MSPETLANPMFHPEVWQARPAERAALLQNYLPESRQDSARQVQRIQKEYGADSPEAIAAVAFAQLAEPIGEIALAHMRDYAGSFRSWREYAPEACRRLEEVLTAWQKRGLFMDEAAIFRRCLDCQSGQEMGQLNLELERIAIRRSEAGRPVFLFTLDDSYVAPNRNSDLPLQAGLPAGQLLIPLPEAERRRYHDETHSAWEYISALHGRDDTLPPVVLGRSVLAAGTEVLTPTMGQGFQEGGFVLAPNLMVKREPALRVARKLLGVKEHPLEMWYLAKLLLAHELSHSFDKFYPGEDSRLLAEIRSDVPAAIALLTRVKEDPRIKIMVLVAEVAVSIFETTVEEGAVYSGYALSGTAILKMIFSSGVIIPSTKEDSEFTIHEGQLTELVSELLSLQHQLMSNDQQTIAELKHISFSHDSREFFQRFRQMASPPSSSGR